MEEEKEQATNNCREKAGGVFLNTREKNWKSVRKRPQFVFSPFFTSEGTKPSAFYYQRFLEHAPPYQEPEGLF